LQIVNVVTLGGARRIAALTILFWAALPASIFAAKAAPPPANAPVTDKDVLQYLDYTIAWYRRASSLDPTPFNAQDVLFRDTLRQNSRQLLKLGFDFAQTEATLLTTEHRGESSAGMSDRERNIHKLAAEAQQRVAQIQSEIDQLDHDGKTASAASRPVLDARRGKLVAQLNLANARRDVLQNVAGFMSDSTAGGGLVNQIDQLQQSFPEIQGTSAGSSTTRPAASGADAVAAEAAIQSQSSGILGLITELFNVSGRLKELKELDQYAALLSGSNERLRLPMRAELQNEIRRSDALSQPSQSDDPKALDTLRQELDQLTARFRLTSSAAVPLGEQSIILDSVRNNLLKEWRSALDRQFDRALRSLLIRVTATAIAIVVLLGLSALWRRATFRYVSDAKRRRQFLLLRRIVVSCIIMVIIFASVITEFGSIATFAGLITAGIAVALQTVILSGFAYFFFIGRYGVRVGDRITISGISGDVIETGLFRLYLLELAGTGRDLQPTGRLVVFSNSVLFQNAPFFKQIPGTNYTWHEMAITLSPESDYRLAETLLLAAVQLVYAEYHEEIERQYSQVKESLHVQLAPPRAEGRLRFVDAGLEFVVRYPVEIRRAAEIDDKLTRALIQTIEKEPKLRLVSTSTPRIQPAAVS
jgi:small-conductance mechanosensitive channel